MSSPSQQSWYKRMRREGKCVNCGAPSEGKALCPEHHKANQDRISERRLTGVTISNRLCSYCEQPGHNRQTCERRKKDNEEKTRKSA